MPLTCRRQRIEIRQAETFCKRLLCPEIQQLDYERGLVHAGTGPEVASRWLVCYSVADRARAATPDCFAMTLLRVLPLFILAVGAGEVPPAITVRVQAIRVADDDGFRGAYVSPKRIGEWVDFANKCFAPAGIGFVFKPDEGDFASVNSTVLNKMTGVGDANWRDAKRLGGTRSPGATPRKWWSTSATGRTRRPLRAGSPGGTTASW